MTRSVDAGTREQLAADGALAVAEPPIAVFAVGDRAYAVGDRCPHRGCPLSAGSVDGTTVTCGCHGSQFDVTTGAVVRGPATAGVPTYETRYEGERIVVDIPD